MAANHVQYRVAHFSTMCHVSTPARAVSVFSKPTVFKYGKLTLSQAFRFKTLQLFCFLAKQTPRQITSSPYSHPFPVPPAPAVAVLAQHRPPGHRPKR